MLLFVYSHYTSYSDAYDDGDSDEVMCYMLVMTLVSWRCRSIWGTTNPPYGRDM